MSIRALAGGGVLAFALVLAGCGRGGKSASEAPAPGAAPTAGVPVLAIPTPAPPAWAVGVVGKPPPEVKAGAVACLGAIDREINRFGAERPGTQIEGWAWNRTAKAPLAHVLVVGSNGLVLGVGEPGGSLRPDVPAANPGVVTTPAVGWLASAPVTSGMVRVLGLTAEGDACDLGTFALKG